MDLMSHTGSMVLHGLFRRGTEHADGSWYYSDSLRKLVNSKASDDALTKAVRDLEINKLLRVQRAPAGRSQVGRPPKVLSAPWECPLKAEKRCDHREERSNPIPIARAPAPAFLPTPPRPTPTDDPNYPAVVGIIASAGVVDAAVQVRTYGMPAAWIALSEWKTRLELGLRVDSPRDFLSTVMRRNRTAKGLTEEEQQAVLDYFLDVPERGIVRFRR